MAGLLFGSIALGVNRFQERKERKKFNRNKQLLEHYYPPLPTTELEARERLARKRHNRNNRRQSEPDRLNSDPSDPFSGSAAGNAGGRNLNVTPAEFDRLMSGESPEMESGSEGESEHGGRDRKTEYRPVRGRVGEESRANGASGGGYAGGGETSGSGRGGGYARPPTGPPPGREHDIPDVPPPTYDEVMRGAQMRSGGTEPWRG